MNPHRDPLRQTDATSIAELWLHTDPEMEKPAAIAIASHSASGSPSGDMAAAVVAPTTTALTTTGWMTQRGAATRIFVMSGRPI